MTKAAAALPLEPQSSPDPNEVYAALDLGSNSFHMLVAKIESGKLVIIDRHKENVRLASGLRSDGTLSKPAVKRALESLYRFAERLRPVSINHMRVVGTNTLRAAKNADSFLERAEEILQSPVSIIRGAEEARLIYQAIARDLAPGDKRRLVIDIGGGSTEIIVGDRRPRLLESLYLGCVIYSKRFFVDGKISPQIYKKASLAARTEIQGAVSKFNRRHWDEAIGSSGTIRAIESVLEGMKLNSDHMITLAGLEQLAGSLCKFSEVDQIQLPNLSDERRDVFPGGLVILHALFQELGIEKMHVSSYALREGIIFELAGLEEIRNTRDHTVNRMMEQYNVDQSQAQRVAHFTLSLLEQVRDDIENYERSRQLLNWSMRLHEIGLALSHSGHHKHGAYLLLHSDMPGFSKQEQKLLSFIVLNHRRKLRPLPQTYGFDPDWRLVQIARLACLFCRRRDDSVLPRDLRIKVKNDGIKCWLPSEWLDHNPLSREDLNIEQHYLTSLKLKLDIKEVTQ
jgi:exopolyphosphatase/guanosine-5'-triphosphate,3'-diphosphate pyrophosphatase